MKANNIFLQSSLTNESKDRIMNFTTLILCNEQVYTCNII